MSIKQITQSKDFISYKSNTKNNQMIQQETLPIFLFKVNIKSITIQPEYLMINNNNPRSPIVAIKFLNYPLIIYPINHLNYSNQQIPIDQSSSIYFQLPLLTLQLYLKRIPLYIVLLDKSTQQILASARIHLSIFSENSFLSYSPSAKSVPNPKRKVINLMLLNLKTIIGNIDISLVIRREYFINEISKVDQLVNKPNKEITIFIAQPVIYSKSVPLKGIDLPLDSKWSYEFEVMNNLQSDIHESNSGICNKNENDKERQCNRQNRLGIFTGTTFPNPNTIFYDNQSNKEKSNNYVKVNESKKDIKNENNEEYLELQSVNNSLNEIPLQNQIPQNETHFYKLSPFINHIDPIKQKINYDKFTYESYLQHINNRTHSLRKIKAIIEEKSNLIS